MSRYGLGGGWGGQGMLLGEGGRFGLCDLAHGGQVSLRVGCLVEIASRSMLRQLGSSWWVSSRVCSLMRVWFQWQGVVSHVGFGLLL